MTRRRPTLTLEPEACDRCGRCERVCAEGAIKVGQAHIIVDWERCDDCRECVDVCDRGAVRPRTPAVRQASAALPVLGGPGVPLGPATTAASSTPRFLPRRSGAKDGANVWQWGMGEAVVVACVAVAASVGLGAYMRSEAVQAMPTGAAVWARAGALGVYYVVQLAALLGLAIRRGLDPRTAFSLSRPGSVVRAALLVVGLVVGLRVASTAYGVVVQYFGWSPPVDWSTSLTELFGTNALGLALTVVMVVLVGPFTEELLFRSVLLEALTHKWGVRVGVVASGVLFAALHMSLWLLLPTAILGFALAWITIDSESLYPAVALHSLYNGIAVAVAFYLAGVT